MNNVTFVLGSLQQEMQMQMPSDTKIRLMNFLEVLSWLSIFLYARPLTYLMFAFFDFTKFLNSALNYYTIFTKWEFVWHTSDLRA